MKVKWWLIGEASRRWLPNFEAASRGPALEPRRYEAVTHLPGPPLLQMEHGFLLVESWNNFLLVPRPT
jgi:hypothetical protein